MSDAGKAIAGIGIALRGLRRMRGMTQEQVASKAGITAGCVGNIERGIPSTTRTINKIAAALGFVAHVTFRRQEGGETITAELDDPRQQKLFEANE